MISVILPTFNEALNIEEMILEVKKHLNKGDEIIVVDDSSPDGTAKIVEDLKSKITDLSIIVRTVTPGLTNSIQEGIENAKGDIVVWLDCDLSQPPKEIPKLVAAIEKDNFDVVVGSRYVPGGSDVRAKSLGPTVMIQVVLSFTLRVLTSIVLWKKFADWSSGYIAIRKSALDKLCPLQGDYGEYFIVLIYNAYKHGFSVKELPYILSARQRGESKTATNVLGLVKRGVKYLKMVFDLRFNRL